MAAFFKCQSFKIDIALKGLIDSYFLTFLSPEETVIFYSFLLIMM